MKKYNFSTNEYDEVEIYCDGCGELIDSSKGYKEKYIEDEDKVRRKVVLGSCCAGKIHAYGCLSKKARESYRSKGQISDEVLSKMPKAPMPAPTPKEAARPTDNFLDAVGRSKLSKSYDSKISYKRPKGLKS